MRLILLLAVLLVAATSCAAAPHLNSFMSPQGWASIPAVSTSTAGLCPVITALRADWVLLATGAWGTPPSTGAAGFGTATGNSLSVGSAPVATAALILPVVSGMNTAASNTARLYIKANGLYVINSAGAEKCLTSW